MAIYSSLAIACGGLSNAFCWLYVVLKAMSGAFGVGSIVQYVGALGKLGAGIQDMMFVLADNKVYCGHLKALFEYLDIPNHKYKGTIPVEKRAFCDQGDMEYEIEFRNVSFRYPGAREDSLKHVNLKFKIGQKLAIVGMNGSGKTTCIKLLCRLYDPTEGQILLNGIDIRKYKYEEYLSIFPWYFRILNCLHFLWVRMWRPLWRWTKERQSGAWRRLGWASA